MSYILDALRRADAERERGTVPGLQSQQHAVADDDAASARRHPLVWAVVALAAALLAALAWNFFGGTPPARPVSEGSVGPVPALLPTTPVAPAAPLTAQSATASGRALVEPTPTRTAPAVVARPGASRLPAEAKRAASRHGGEATSAPLSAGASPAPRSAGEGRIYAQAELPEEIRRDLPKVAIGGSSYSGDAASRMIMINGQVFHEGDRLGAGLVLERIKQKSAVLAYKGWRYEVVF